MSDNKEYNLYDYIAIVLSYKKRIIIASLIIGVLTAIVVFVLMDKIYLSTGTVQSSSSSSGLGALLGGSIPDIGGLSDIGGGSSKELALYEEILMSRRCIEETIVKFSLMEEYESKYMQDAVKTFRDQILLIIPNKKAGILEIGIYDKSPQKAQEMASFMIMQLNTIYTELSVQGAKNNRIYLEERYNLVRSDLRKIEDSLKVFQQIHGVAPDIQIKAAAQSAIELEAQIASEEVKLDLLRKILTPDQAEIKAQEEKIAALNKQLFDIRSSDQSNSMLNLRDAPDVMINYLRLQRDLEIQTKILTTILPLYEQAKIEENKETPTVLVLDQPDIPDRKKKPKRATAVLISLVLSSIIFSVTAVLYETSYKKLKDKVINAEQGSSEKE